ncbi:hypothetical protein [Motilibacter aurantiacus]|uniref:hypothetical protein n=1 Tax=Motilibacter aurantiacus TaxID=2714955 RepID=UPI00140CB12A|nr:hypothetical protein [Motilibacter aurantiacus]NHC45187.1 hypothetical protein [Motilibacter aurantiacus]
MTNGSVSTDGMSRRDALKKGVLVGGAVWAVPAIQAIGVGVADAASTTAPKPPTPTVPSRPTPCVPAAGLLLCTVWKWGWPCLVGVRIDGNGRIDCIPTDRDDKDARFLRSLGYSTWFKPSDLGLSVSGGYLSGRTGLYLLLPTLASFVKAWVSDVDLCSPSSSSGHEEAHCSGGRVIFSKYV